MDMDELLVEIRLDDQVHDLVRSGPNGDQAHVTQQMLDRGNVRVAEATGKKSVHRFDYQIPGKSRWRTCRA